MTRTATFLLILILTLPCFSSPAPLRRIATYDSRTGLSNAYVMAMAEDGAGFLWIGTECGLFRHDGYRATAGVWQKSAESEPLAATNISRLMYDRRTNRLWVGTRYEGLFAIDLTSGAVHRYKMPQPQVVGLKPAAAGRVWVLTNDALTLLDPATGGQRTYDRSNTRGLTHYFTDLAITPRGTLLIATHDNGLIAFAPSTAAVRIYNKENAGLPSDCLRGVCWAQGTTYIATAKGAAMLRGATPARATTLTEPYNLMAIARARDGHLWLATENEGIVIIGGGNSRVLTRATTPAVSNKTTKSLLIDSRGNVMAGTYGDGVDVYTDALRTFDTYSDALSQKEVTALAYDPATASVWVGTDGGGINRLAPDGTVTPVYDTRNSPMPDGAVLSAARTGDGTTYFGTYGGALLALQGGQLRQCTTTRTGDIRTIAPLARGRLALGMAAGIAVYDTGTGTTQNYETRKSHLSPDGSMSQRALNQHVRALAYDAATATLYAGTEGHGLDIYRDSGAGLRPLRHADTPSPFIYDIAIAGRRVLLATGTGLYEYVPKTGRCTLLYPAPRGVRAVEADESDASAVWLTTPDRVYHFRLATRTATDYTFRCGTIASDFSPRTLLVVGGHVYTGSHQGLAAFQQGASIVRLPPVRISNIADGVQGNSLTGEVHLPASRDMFSVDFSVLDPRYTDKAEYAYCLRGTTHTEWRTLPQGTSTITFHSMRHGRYLLRLRARLPNQPWSEQYTELQIVIAPPAWLSWWAWLIYCAIVIGAAWGIAHQYSRHVRLTADLDTARRQREQEQQLTEERMRFFTNITHELRTPLSLIIAPASDLAGDGTLGDAAKRKLATIERNAQRLLDLVNHILEFRRTETQNRQLTVAHGNIARLVEEIGLRYREATGQKHGARLQVITTIAPADYDIVFDAEAITTIVDNLMSNAIKYTDSGSVSLGLERKGDDIVVSVSDTGRGISPEALPHIFERYFRASDDPNITSTGIGLALASNLARLHQASLTCAANNGPGTTFTLTLSATATYPDANHSRDVQTTIDSVYTPQIMDGADDSRSVVLVVEDNDEIRQYIAETLADEYLVHTAADGQEGLEKARALVPDIIVSDIMMPRLDGMDMARAIKTDIATSHIPIIFLTAKASTEDRTEAYTLGADSFIPKPFTARMLLARIRNILDCRARVWQKVAGNVAGSVAQASACGVVRASTRTIPTDARGLKPAQTPQAEACATLPQAEACATRQQILEESLSRLDQEFLEKLDRVVSKHISDENLDVAMIAQAMNMSNSTLWRKMKAVTGLSANAYVRRRRARRAEQLLLTARYTVSEVAYMVGMSSVSNFRAMFRDEFGISPSEILKGARNK